MGTHPRPLLACGSGKVPLTVKASTDFASPRKLSLEDRPMLLLGCLLSCTWLALPPALCLARAHAADSRSSLLAGLR